MWVWEGGARGHRQEASDALPALPSDAWDLPNAPMPRSRQPMLRWSLR